MRTFNSTKFLSNEIVNHKTLRGRAITTPMYMNILEKRSGSSSPRLFSNRMMSKVAKEN